MHQEGGDEQKHLRNNCMFWTEEHIECRWVCCGAASCSKLKHVRCFLWMFCMELARWVKELAVISPSSTTHRCKHDVEVALISQWQRVETIFDC